MASASATQSAVRIEPRIANILFATDFSPCSERALPYASMLAKQHRATLHLIHVAGPYPLVGPLGAPYADVERENEDARRRLQALSRSSEMAFRHECSVHRGTVSEVVCRLVEDRTIDVVVMATHGRRGVRQFVLGSVAEQVFRSVGCPVLTIGPGARIAGPASGRFSTILAALDLSPGSRKVFAFAHAFAKTNTSALVLFHTVPWSPERQADNPTYLDDAVVTCKRQLEYMLPTDLPRADISIKIGSPAEMILQTAEDRNADLIVIGARRGLRLATHNPWAVAHEVVCGASCPVLTVGH